MNQDFMASKGRKNGVLVVAGIIFLGGLPDILDGKLSIYLLINMMCVVGLVAVYFLTKDKPVIAVRATDEGLVFGKENIKWSEIRKVGKRYGDSLELNMTDSRKLEFPIGGIQTEQQDDFETLLRSKVK